MITLGLVGDVMLGRGVDEALENMRPGEPWGDALPVLGDADLRIVNLECAITTHDRPWNRTPKTFHFRADPSRAVGVLRAARIEACSLANNHTLDFEEEGLLDTLKHLDGAAIRHAGAGRDLEEAARAAILEGPDKEKVALLAFTDNEPPFAAGVERPGTNYLPTSLEPEVLSRVEAAIAGAREAGAETILFSVARRPEVLLPPVSRGGGAAPFLVPSALEEAQALFGAPAEGHPLRDGRGAGDALLLDSTLLSVLHPRRVPQGSGFCGAAWVRWGSFSVYGVKLHLICATKGVPLSYELTPFRTSPTSP